mmetsp:Transcript_17667/g.49276  ORF Transcript_17667/g.49276 Transcript_17667/m.49276 type:complete len:227 (+) Transcript_17667:638-1318(+)
MCKHKPHRPGPVRYGNMGKGALIRQLQRSGQFFQRKWKRLPRRDTKRTYPARTAANLVATSPLHTVEMSTPHTAARARRSRAIGVTPEAEAAKGGALLAAPPAADLAALSTACLLTCCRAAARATSDAPAENVWWPTKPTTACRLVSRTAPQMPMRHHDIACSKTSSCSIAVCCSTNLRFRLLSAAVFAGVSRVSCPLLLLMLLLLLLLLLGLLKSAALHANCLVT